MHRLLVSWHDYQQMAPWQQALCAPNCSCGNLPAGSLLVKLVCVNGHPYTALERLLFP